MYLVCLNEEEKELFLGMAYHLATSDGEYGEEEKSAIEGYCQEMQCTFDESAVKPFEELVGRLNVVSEDKVKRIITFELVGLAIADGIYGDDEQELMLTLEKSFGLEEGFVEECENILFEYISFQQKLNEFILG